MNPIEELKKEFLQIKAQGFVLNTRPKNRDGGIGNTFEDLLGVKENNLSEADFKGIEIKSQRLFNSSFISLFTKAPSFPKRANNHLRETYGEIRQEEHSDKKVLFCSIFGNRESLVYEKYKIKLHIDREKKRIILIIKDLKDNLLTNEVYWDFSTLQEASKKLDRLFLVLAETKKIDNEPYCHFTEGRIYYDFNFEKFLTELELGSIMFDIRIGVYNSGKNYGKTHDHGSGFRIKKENFHKLYTTFEIIK
jgi:hypothetical protein